MDPDGGWWKKMKPLWENREINQMEERWRRTWVWLCARYRHQGWRVGKDTFIGWVTEGRNRSGVWTSQIICIGVLGNWCVLSLSGFYKCAPVSWLVLWSTLVALRFWVQALDFWQHTFLLKCAQSIPSVAKWIRKHVRSINHVYLCFAALKRKR